MNAYKEYMKFAADGSSRSTPGSRDASLIREIVKALKLRWHDRSVASSLRSLERLDDRLLKDVDLFCEHLPSGETRHWLR